MRLGLTKDSSLRYDNILAIPSIHSRVYFSELVRIAVANFKPTIIAIEQPEVFSEALREAVSRLPFISVIVRETEDGAMYIPVDPCDSVIEGVRTAIAFEIPLACVDKDVTTFPYNSRYIMPDDYLLTKMSLEGYYNEILARYSFFEKEDEQVKREKFIAGKIGKLAEEYERVLYIGGIAHWENIKRFLAEKTLPQIEIEREGNLTVYNLHKDSYITVLGELPFITYVYWLHRTGKEKQFEKLQLIERIYYESKVRYKLPISLTQRKGMLRYVRNLALLEHRVTPDYIDILTAAKGFVNNEYALDVLETVQYYPYYKDNDKRYPTVQIEKDPESEMLEAFLKEKKIKLSRRDYIWKTPLKKVRLRERPPEAYKGEWQDAWRRRTSQMSHVPEDIRMENYMNYVRHRIIMSLGENRMKIEPFRSSVKDGIDMKETIRNYHKREIYVREIPKVNGNVGPVVFIFDDKQEAFDRDYTWRIVWLSEAHDDSDLVLYATEPGYELVGPGISRCYFGGYTSIMPPQEVSDVWAFYPLLAMNGIIKTPQDLLLYAGARYSEDRYVGYIAPKPPSERVKHYVEKEFKVEIVYLPLATFSSETVRKLRSFHVLGNKRLRTIANRYILD